MTSEHPPHRAPVDAAPSAGAVGPSAMPSAEVDVDAGLVARLLRDQHPDLAERPLTELANGWDNVMFRLGGDLVVRLPRRQAAAALVEHEQRWLPVLAPRLPLPVPAPVRIGTPTAEYPWAWSILPWLHGVPAGLDPDLDGAAVAEQLGRFLAALHRPAPADAPHNPFRGVPLRDREASFMRWVDALSPSSGPPSGRGRLLDRDAVLRRWSACVEAPIWDGPPIWLHGDLHGHNLLADRGRLVAVIDFGDITGGDPATDLGVAWSLLDRRDWATFRRAADSAVRPVDEAMWLRAEGNALAVAVAILANSADNPTMAAMARRALGSLDLDASDSAVEGGSGERNGQDRPG